MRFDKVSRALYSTDASVYQIEPVGVVVVKSRADVVETVKICRQFGCSMTMRGGGTSQAGQAIGAGLQVDTSKYFNRLLEVNAAERWARIEPGIVLDELNVALRPHGLRFAPDISTANRATVGGMMANNSSGARSVLYGKTIDHVLDAGRRPLGRFRGTFRADRSGRGRRDLPPRHARGGLLPRSAPARARPRVRNRRSLPKGAPPRRRLQPRRLRRRVAPRRHDATHRRLRRHARGDPRGERSTWCRCRRRRR